MDTHGKTGCVGEGRGLMVKTDVKAGLTVNPLVGLIMVILTEIGRALN